VITPRVEVGPSFHTRAQVIGGNQSESGYAPDRLLSHLAGGGGS
jgi:hypothetical protein